MSTTFEPLHITEPGVYEMSSSQYFADPVAGGSLNASGAKTILRSPAHYMHDLLKPKISNDEQLFGSAVHTIVLGAGADLEIIDADSYRTKTAQGAKDEALAAGRIPILEHRYSVAQRMAEVVWNHPEARPLLAGQTEQILVWRSHGIWRRAMIDVLLDDGAADYKTTQSCELFDIAKTVYQYKYHQQAAWYVDGIKALNLCPDPQFRFIFQEKESPYAVRVVQLDFEAMAIGHDDNVAAMGIYRDCCALDEWPAYPNHTAVISLPSYARTRQETPSCL